MELKERLRVGVVGATGLVGQRLVERLDDHPWFEPTVLAASERSAGRSYAEATEWRLGGAPPARSAGLEVRPAEPASFAGCDLVFSSLDPAGAREIEGALVDAGFPVVSNSSAYRMDPAVPLVIPEVNAGHLELLPEAGKGFIVTNPNCAVIGLALALAPLHRAFGVRRLVVSTMQAVSGAGSAGPRALDLLDNVIPFIPREEEKIETELCKLFGRVADDTIATAEIAVSAHCHRVPTLDGHLEAVSVELDRPATPDEAREVIDAFRGDTEGLELPGAPARPLVVAPEHDRPQPRLDRDCGGGMSVVVGRVRPCPVLGLRLELLSHNTVRGAAGGTILVAELLAARGHLRRGDRR